MEGRFPALSARSRVLVLALAALALAGLTAATAFGAASLMRSFGKGGIVDLGARRTVQGVGATSDGGSVAVGFAGTRMLVVTTNAKGGARHTISAGGGVANAVAVQRDGKIVVAGRTSASSRSPANGAMVVKRFTPKGSADRTFGSRGATTLKASEALAVAIARDGKIVVAGTITGSDGFPRVAVARLLANGRADTSFGSGGVATIDIGRNSRARGVAIQRDGKVVIAGEAVPQLQAISALAARVTTRGLLDRGFGTDGTYQYGHPKGGAAATLAGVAIDSAGRIVLAGADQQTGGPAALFVRLGRSGRADGSFGTRGVLTTPSARHYGGGDLVGARSVAIAGRGEIVAAGAFKDSGLTSPALWSITTRGRLDTRGGPVGRRLIETSGALGGESNAVAVAPSGTIYAGGSTIAVKELLSGAFVAAYGGYGRP